jgi:hypothetical protein
MTGKGTVEDPYVAKDIPGEFHPWAKVAGTSGWYYWNRVSDDTQIDVPPHFKPFSRIGDFWIQFPIGNKRIIIWNAGTDEVVDKTILEMRNAKEKAKNVPPVITSSTTTTTSTGNAQPSVMPGDTIDSKFSLVDQKTAETLFSQYLLHMLNADPEVVKDDAHFAAVLTAQGLGSSSVTIPLVLLSETISQIRTRDASEEITHLDRQLIKASLKLLVSGIIQSLDL